ncbi:hypothetical protein CBR_g34434 [Chara braunii]|uniref:Reverse transcriptase domain-containing protein n=1 Tax=Chara braunii TaxID=69332 RepID=A0A388LIT9_CHABU|nr:hypothetical protein CBR_g34434 [Chara braunii]|eukprot:GBG82153.1 hypothetical protein CBR_g34434 [Chara braunii]
MWNSKNVSCGCIVSPETLEACIGKGIARWVKGRKEPVKRRDMEKCYGQWDSAQTLAMTTNEVRRVFRKYTRLVVVPIDQNPEATLLLCPMLYHRACVETFNCNTSFRVLQKSEAQIIARMKDEYVRRGLDRIARWQIGGKIGQAYILPKDKDLGRWRPISPSTFDPARLAATRVGKAIRFMLFGIKRADHFDLKSMDEMGEWCKGVEGKLRACGDGVLARSYDIKDMFARLSHESVLDAVEWVTRYHEKKGMKGVKVSLRGKMCAMVKRMRKEEGFTVISFDDVRKEAEFELSQSFVKCIGNVLSQHFGIPMGRNSSPSLARLVCAKAESAFMRRTYEVGLTVRGMRMIDDVAVMVGFAPGISETFRRVVQMLDEFERCYDENLKLVRKDEGGNAFDFLGNRVIIEIEPVRVNVLPRTKKDA